MKLSEVEVTVVTVMIVSKSGNETSKKGNMFTLSSKIRICGTLNKEKKRNEKKDTLTFQSICQARPTVTRTRHAPDENIILPGC